jgi:hypothetical protein
VRLQLQLRLQPRGEVKQAASVHVEALLRRDWLRRRWMWWRWLRRLQRHLLLGARLLRGVTLR